MEKFLRVKFGKFFNPKMENNFRYITGQRGAILLVFKGFIYNSDKNRTDLARWRCQNRACPGVLFITLENTIHSAVEHNHAEVWDKIRRIEIMRNVREKAINTSEKYTKIITKHCTEISESENIDKMPSTDYIRDVVKKKEMYF
jgi:hypothetical protein